MKGNRECKYPEPRAELKSISRTNKDASHQNDYSSSEDNIDKPSDRDQLPDGLQAAAQDNLDVQAGSHPRQVTAIDDSSSIVYETQSPVESTTDIKDGRSPPTRAASISSSATFDQAMSSSTQPTEASGDEHPWSHLPEDLRHNLNYHYSNVTFHHYFFKHDADAFLHTSLIERALNYEPLLFAVVGFAAFQHTVNHRHGHVSDFFGYYNRSVTLLRRSLASGIPNTDATLLTVLQLATFEVSLPIMRGTSY